MTTTNRLCYTVSKRYIQAGTTFEINVKILLADDCKNNICDWSITADIYEQRKNGRFLKNKSTFCFVLQILFVSL